MRMIRERQGVPMPSILDPKFKYVNSTATDIRKTFARVRREQQRANTADKGPPPQLVALVPRRRIAR